MLNALVLRDSAANIHKMHRRAFVLILLFGVTLGGKLPSNFQKCKVGDHLDECLKRAIPDAVLKMAHGLPELGATPLEPLEIQSLSIEAAGSAVGVENQRHTNMKIYNLTKAIMKTINTTVTREQFASDMTYTVPEIRIESDYLFKGRILVLPINGQGKSVTIFKDCAVALHLFSDVVKKKGKSYYRIKDFEFTMDPQHASYYFENIISGDERLSAETNKVLNDNWKVLLEDVKPAYQKAFGDVFKAYSNNIFSKIDIKSLFDE